LEKTSKIH